MQFVTLGVASEPSQSSPFRRSHAAATPNRAHRRQEPVLRFRNYQPASESLQGLDVPKPEVPNVEEELGTAEVIHKDATQEPLLNLAPKRANWDLKRDIEPQMNKLRKMTDQASTRAGLHCLPPPLCRMLIRVRMFLSPFLPFFSLSPSLEAHSRTNSRGGGYGAGRDFGAQNQRREGRPRRRDCQAAGAGQGGRRISERTQVLHYLCGVRGLLCMPYVFYRQNIIIVATC